MLVPREIWKDIPGYEGLYQVSNIGNVRSLNYNRTGKVKRLKTYYKVGYKCIGLYANGEKKNYRVHRLVAEAFLPNPNNYSDVNHKDENPSNNCVWNLEWCTRHYNINYGTRNERHSKTNKGKEGYWKGKSFSEEHKRKIRETKRMKRS